MEISNKTREEDFGGSVLESMLPIVLESRIQTCIVNYRKEKHRVPNAVILSDEARAVLLKTRLLLPSLAQEVRERDALAGGNFQLKVYRIDEFSEEKKFEINKRFSGNPRSFYLGRTKWEGLGKKIKISSLVWYNFAVSSGDLA